MSRSPLDEEMEDAFRDVLNDTTLASSRPEENSYIGLLKVAIVAGTVFGIIGTMWVMAYILWTWGLSSVSTSEKAYTKMKRLGTWALANIDTNCSPNEYAAMLGTTIPTIARDARQIALAYSISRYSNHTSVIEEVQEVEQAWKNIRRSLCIKALARLLHVGGRS